MDPQTTGQGGSGQQDGQRFYHAQSGYQLILSLSKDEMECRAQLTVPVNGAPPTVDELRAFLQGDGITIGINETALEVLRATAPPGKTSNGVVACGMLPVRGDNGRLEYAITTQEKQPEQKDEGVSEEKRQVDFRSVQQFINVEPEQEIGRILPPTAGTPGRTVRNAPVAAEPGTPLQVKLGQNVRYASEHPDALIAETNGRVKFDGESIQVVEEYVVDGDVDFNIGNIRFNGFVEIRGDVLDGFQISASKGLKITGNVGACRLISHGDIEFCGMDGAGKGSVLCGGSLRANFIHDANIECWGNMTVTVELLNSSVRCRGTLECGLFAGGECVILGGMSAKRLGAPSAVKTRVMAGISYQDLERLRELMELAEDVQNSLLKTSKIEELTHLTAEKNRLALAIVEVKSRRPPGANAKVNVKDKIHEGVTITLGSSVEEFRSELGGPLSLIENSLAGGLRRLSMTGLDVMAAELEKGCRQRDEEEQREKDRLEAEEREKAAAEAAAELAASQPPQESPAEEPSSGNQDQPG